MGRLKAEDRSPLYDKNFVQVFDCGHAWLPEFLEEELHVSPERLESILEVIGYLARYSKAGTLPPFIPDEEYGPYDHDRVLEWLHDRGHNLYPW